MNLSSDNASVSQDRVATYLAKSFGSNTLNVSAGRRPGWREPAAFDREIFLGSDHNNPVIVTFPSTNQDKVVEIS